MLEKEYYLGVDLGGTKILTALSNRKGEILSKIKVPTGARDGQEAVIQRILDSLTKVLEDERVLWDEIHSLGIGVPSPVPSSEGIIKYASNLGWRDVPFKKILEERLGLLVRIENDANTAAWGEKCFGIGQGFSDLIYITISTGIGGGIILEDRIFQGISGSAGEFGHIPILDGGPKCGCGRRGCLEAVAAGPALLKKAKLVALKEKTLMEDLAGGVEKIKGETILEAAQKGDPQAILLYQEIGEILGKALAGVVATLNPQLIIIGGGVGLAGEFLLRPLRETLEEKTFPPSLENLKILPAQLGYDAGILGALALVIYPNGTGDNHWIKE